MWYSIVAGFLFALLVSVAAPCRGQSYEWRRIHPEAAQHVLPVGDSAFWALSWFSLRLYRGQDVLSQIYFPREKDDWDAYPSQLIRTPDYLFACIDELYRIDTATGAYQALTKYNAGMYIQASPTGIILMLDWWPTLSRSTDGGKSFKGFKPGGWIGTLPVRDMEAYQTGFIAITSQGVPLISRDSGSNWERIVIDLPADSIGRASEVVVLRDSILLISVNVILQEYPDSSYDALFRSTDGGISWQMTNADFEWPVLNAGGEGSRVIVLSSVNINSTTGLRTYVSDDGGETWVDFISPSIEARGDGDVEVAGDRALLATESGVYELSIPSGVAPQRSHPVELMLSTFSGHPGM